MICSMTSCNRLIGLPLAALWNFNAELFPTYTIRIQKNDAAVTIDPRRQDRQ
jgi:hypothetical protein